MIATEWVAVFPGQGIGVGRSRVVWKGIWERVGSQMAPRSRPSSKYRWAGRVRLGDRADDSCRPRSTASATCLADWSLALPGFASALLRAGAGAQPVRDLGHASP